MDKTPILVLLILLAVSFQTAHTPASASLVPSQNPSQPMVAVDPSSIANLSKTSGTITVTVNITGSPSIDFFLVSVQYNNSVLHAVSLDNFGNVLGDTSNIIGECLDGRFVLGDQGTHCQSWDGPGFVTFWSTMVGSDTTPNPTNGLLFRVTFSIIARGFSSFHLFRAEVSNPFTNLQLSPTTSDGYFTNVDCPLGSGTLCRPPTVSLTWLPSILVEGITASFTVTVADPNKGASTSSYHWSWGDSSPNQDSSLETMVHSYYLTGNYTASFGITDSYGASAYRNVILPVIPHFSLRADPQTVKTIPGQTVTSTITVTTLGSGFTGLVSLGLTSYPTNAKGFSASIFPTSVSLDPVNMAKYATLTINAQVAGGYNVVVNGSATGFEPQTINVQVQVGDFEMTTSPGVADAGEPATSTIRLYPEYGLTQAVNLSYAAVPPGLSCGTITPISLNGPSGASLSCNSELASDYRVVVYGTDGPSSHNATASFVFLGGGQSVNRTWVLDNGNQVTGNYSPTNGPLKVPTSLAYDSKDDRIFVTNGYSIVTAQSANLISVIDAQTNRLLNNIPFGNARGIAYDSVNDNIYVANASGLAVINGATETVVANVPMDWATAVALNSANNEILVAQSTTVAILNATTDAIIANVTVAGQPTSLVYDSFHNYVYADLAQSETVSIIDGKTDSVIGNVTSSYNLATSDSLQSMAYDPSNHNIYTLGSDIVYVVNGQSVIGNVTVHLGSVLTECYGRISPSLVPLCNPQIAYDASNNEVYVTDGSTFASGNVTIIDPASLTIVARSPAGFGPTGIAYDSSTGNMYVADSGSESLSVLSSQTNAIVATIAVEAYPADVAYDPANGLIYIANSGSYSYGVYKAVVSEALFGLNTTAGTINVMTTGGLEPSSIVYDPYSNEIFVAELFSNTVSVINPSSGSVLANIPVGFEPTALVYVPYNHDVYVASSDTLYPDKNSVTVIDGTLNEVVANITAGNYPFGLAYDPESNDIFVSHSATLCGCSNYSFITVVSASTNSVVANFTVGKAPTGIVYDPTNNEVYVADIMSNSVWAVNAATYHTVADITVGSFQVGLVYDPADNEIFVTDGSPTVNFDRAANIVSVISASTNTVVGNIQAGFGPSGGAYDPACGCMYIANYFSGTLSQITKVPPQEATSSLSLSCSQNIINVGSFTTCQATVTGTSPSGAVTFSTSSATGTFSPTTGVCTLNTGGCSVTYTDASSSNVTAVISASYSGDVHNTHSASAISITIVKPSNVLVSTSTTVTVSSGSAFADESSTTGISVQITGSPAPEGTLATINTQDLNGPSTRVGTVSLPDAKYYDVVISGIADGNAKICISYPTATSTTTMEYWNGNAWTSANSITVNGGTVCGTIPVSALTGTNIAVANTVKPAPAQPTILGISSTLFYEIVGAVVALVIIVSIAVLVRRPNRTKPTS